MRQGASATPVGGKGGDLDWLCSWAGGHQPLSTICLTHAPAQVQVDKYLRKVDAIYFELACTRTAMIEDLMIYKMLYVND